MTKDELILAQKEFLFPSVFHYFSEPLVLTHAKDQYVWDADGNQFLDFFGGIVTVSVGHCNETVNKNASSAAIEILKIMHPFYRRSTKAAHHKL